MAITSIGYDGTVDENQWSLLAPHLSGPPHVYGLTASILTTSARTTRIAPGWAAGYGIRDDSTSNVDLLSATTTTERWDTVVVRRNRSTNTSTIQLVQGTSTKAVASSALTAASDVAGGTYDIPVHLVRITATSTTVAELVDLRGYAAYPLFFANPSLPSPAGFDLGQVILFDATAAGKTGLHEFYRRSGTDTSPAWSNISDPPWTSLPKAVGAVDVVPSDPAAYRVVDGMLELSGRIARSDGASFPSLSVAGNSATVLGTISNASQRPRVDRPVSTSFQAGAITVTVRANGDITAAPYSGGVTQIPLDGIAVRLS